MALGPMGNEESDIASGEKEHGYSMMKACILSKAFR